MVNRFFGIVIALSVFEPRYIVNHKNQCGGRRKLFQETSKEYASSFQRVCFQAREVMLGDARKVEVELVLAEELR